VNGRSVAAREVHYSRSGPPDGASLVLAPSLGTELSMWETLASSLADRFQVIRYDLRGHGGSPVPAGPYSIAELGADLVALLDRLGLERASLCGISIGGMSAMWVAAHAAGRVDRLVVCCSSAQLDPEAQSRYAERAAIVREYGVEAIADAVVARWFTPAFTGAHSDVVQRMRTELIATPREGYAGCCEALAAMDLRAALPSIRAPTLVIAGREDPALPPRHSDGIAKAIPGARLEVVPEAAHLANIEQPTMVDELIAGHLEAN
jgi:3-oxoadipate enol-lactonase